MNAKKDIENFISSLDKRSENMIKKAAGAIPPDSLDTEKIAEKLKSIDKETLARTIKNLTPEDIAKLLKNKELVARFTKKNNRE